MVGISFNRVFKFENAKDFQNAAKLLKPSANHVSKEVMMKAQRALRSQEPSFVIREHKGN